MRSTSSSIGKWIDDHTISNKHHLRPASNFRIRFIMDEISHVIDRFIIRREGINVSNLLKPEAVLLDIIEREIIAYCVWSQVNLKYLPFGMDDILNDLSYFYAQVCINNGDEEHLDEDELNGIAYDNLTDAIEVLSDIIAFDNYDWLDITGHERLEIIIRRGHMCVCSLGDVRIYAHHGEDYSSKFIEKLQDEKRIYSNRYE